MILLIQPPQWIPTTPHLAVPLLLGQLKAAGIDAEAFDMNIKFYNRILNKSTAKKAKEEAKIILSSLEKELAGADFRELEKNGTVGEKTKALRYLKIKKYFEKNIDKIGCLIDGIDDAVKLIKGKGDFYNPEKLVKAKHTIREALKLVSLPYAPNEIDINNYFANPLMSLDWENIKAQSADPRYNMFIPFTEEVVNTISVKGYDAVVVSLTDLSQLIPVFTLCKMVKERTKAKVILGGNYATQINEDIASFEEIFIDYIDFMIIGDGEIPLVRLCEYIEGRGSLENVPNLIRWSPEDGKVVSAGFSCGKIAMNDLAYADFGDYDLDDYFIPEPVFGVQLGKGCYWGKCKFCDYYYGQQRYSPKSVERIIAELRFYAQKYDAKHFTFVDEAVPPVFYNKLALAIIEAGLDITYYSFARLENGYSPEVLSNLYKSGARIFLWGYECESLRVMKLMNKGIDVENRLKILANARMAGIWNVGLFIFGYPGETREEIEMTKNVIRANTDIIPSITLSNFALKKHSLLLNEAEKNGIKDIKSGGEFYTVLKDETTGIGQLDRRKIRRDFQFEFLDEHKHRLWSVVFSDFEHLLLYLSKYGIDYVQGYRSAENVSPEFK